MLKACHNATVRLLTLPDTHPLHKIVKHAKRSPPTKHLSPIDHLLKTLRLLDMDIETIYPQTARNDIPDRFSTEAAITREVSINLEKADNADFKIYSDGSGHLDGIGAAALLYKNGQARSLKSLQICMGPSEKHNTYKAEATGAILATWILANTPETTRKRVSLYIDNQALVTAVSGMPKNTSGQHLIKTLRTHALTL